MTSPSTTSAVGVAPLSSMQTSNMHGGAYYVNEPVNHTGSIASTLPSVSNTSIGQIEMNSQLLPHFTYPNPSTNSPIYQQCSVKNEPSSPCAQSSDNHDNSQTNSPSSLNQPSVVEQLQLPESLYHHHHHSQQPHLIQQKTNSPQSQQQQQQPEQYFEQHPSILSPNSNAQLRSSENFSVMNLGHSEVDIHLQRQQQQQSQQPIESLPHPQYVSTPILSSSQSLKSAENLIINGTQMVSPHIAAPTTSEFNFSAKDSTIEAQQ